MKSTAYANSRQVTGPGVETSAPLETGTAPVFTSCEKGHDYRNLTGVPHLGVPSLKKFRGKLGLLY